MAKSEFIKNPIAKIIGVALVYFLVGRFGLLFAVPPGYATAVWLPSGVALAAVLLYGNRVWPGIWLGSFLVNTLTFAPLASLTSTQMAVAATIAVGSTMQALLGAFLLHRFGIAGIAYDKPRNVLAFISITAMITWVAATVGVTSLVLSGAAAWSDYALNWVTWWLGDAIGIVLTTPLIMAWRNYTFRWQPIRVVEAGTFILLILVLSAIAFLAGVPILFIVYPMILLATIMFGQRGGTAITLISVMISLWGVVRGLSPLVGDSFHTSILFEQIIMGAVAGTALLLDAELEKFR